MALPTASCPCCALRAQQIPPPQEQQSLCVPCKQVMDSGGGDIWYLFWCSGCLSFRPTPLPVNTPGRICDSCRDLLKAQIPTLVSCPECGFIHPFQEDGACSACIAIRRHHLPSPYSYFARCTGDPHSQAHDLQFTGSLGRYHCRTCRAVFTCSACYAREEVPFPGQALPFLCAPHRTP